jgi:hypothetical protein
MLGSFFIRTATRSAGRGDAHTSGCGGSAGLTRGYIIDTALRCASRYAAIRNMGCETGFIARMCTSRHTL